MAANRGKSSVDRRDRGERLWRGAGRGVRGRSRRCAPGASRNCDTTVNDAADAKLTAAHFRNGPQGARYVFDPTCRSACRSVRRRSPRRSRCR